MIGGAFHVPACLLLIVITLQGFVVGVRAHVASTAVLRNNRQDDLYRREEGVAVTQTGGTIHSPRYPNAYPRNLLLSWKLVSPPGTRIHLEFDDAHFGLEGGENGVCRYDFVEVEDKSETSSIIWGRWCGKKPPPAVTSKTNILKVTFKSDDYFVAKPGFKVNYSMVDNAPPTPSKTNWEPVTSPLLNLTSTVKVSTVSTAVPLSVEGLDRTIASFDTVEQLLRSLNPDTWRQDLDSIFTQTRLHYKARAYHLASRHNKVDLDRLYDDVKRYSCTPRNYSVNLREELRATNAVFFPRCLLVQRCGGNCGCGTRDWNSGCTCRAAKTSPKLHEVLKYSSDMGAHQRGQKPRLRWALDDVFLTHHETCECSCPTRPPR